MSSMHDEHSAMRDERNSQSMRGVRGKRNISFASNIRSASSKRVTHGMRFASIVSEAMRNISSGAAHAIIWFLALIAAGTLLGGFEALTIINQERDAVERINAAADVSAMVSPIAAIDGAACDRLIEARGGPSVSGAMREGQQITPRSTPGRSIGSYEVTAGMIRMLALSASGGGVAADSDIASGDITSGGVADDVVSDDGGLSEGGSQSAMNNITQSANGVDESVDGSVSGSTNSNRSKSSNIPIADARGVWISSTLAHDFGWSQGSMLETTQGDIPIAGIFDWPNDGRDTRFVYSLIVPVSADAEPFSECWAKQWPQTDALDSLLNETAISGLATAQTLPGVTQLNKSHDRRYNAAKLYETRITRALPIVALVIGCVLGMAAVGRRRLEYAGALHCGQRKGDQVLTAMVETLVWGGLAAICVGVLLAAGCWRLSPSDPSSVFMAAVRPLAAVLSGVLIAVPISLLCVRESSLFRLFKAR